jgi:hypothetical protein
LKDLECEKEWTFPEPIAQNLFLAYTTSTGASAKSAEVMAEAYSSLATEKK